LFGNEVLAMAITFDFFVDNIRCLLGGDPDLPSQEEIREAFEHKDASQIAKIICLIAKDIRARSSTLPFPEGHEGGFDPPSRKLEMATRYMDEIARAIGGNPLDPEFPQPTYDQFGWHAFGAAIQAIAGLLAHLEQAQEKAGEDKGDRE
jgi:hypothetical protein